MAEIDRIGVGHHVGIDVHAGNRMGEEYPFAPLRAMNEVECPARKFRCDLPNTRDLFFFCPSPFKGEAGRGMVFALT